MPQRQPLASSYSNVSPNGRLSLSLHVFESRHAKTQTGEKRGAATSLAEAPQVHEVQHRRETTLLPRHPRAGRRGLHPVLWIGGECSVSFLAVVEI